MMKNFSVLMSFYKNENPNTLKLSLKSIVDQKLKPTEIILVQDGPVNSILRSVVEEFQVLNNNCKVIELEKNVGLGRALNIGLKECQYDYVARMDSDDISKPSRFLKQMTYLTEHPEVDVLGTDMEEFTGSLEIFSRKIMPYEHDDIVKYAKKRNPMNHPTVIFKKSKAEAVGGYQHCAYFEDYFLWMRMLKNGCTFHNLDESCLYSRIDEDLYRRRGGISYVKNIISFRRKIRKLGMSNLYDTWWLIMIQSSVAMLPNSFRAHIYRTLLRRNEVKK